jgi:hypothetical protein
MLQYEAMDGRNGVHSMLIQQIVDLLPVIATLSQQEQEALAEDIYAELVDARFRYNIENGVPMPGFEAVVREAEDSEARGELVGMLES